MMIEFIKNLISADDTERQEVLIKISLVSLILIVGHLLMNYMNTQSNKFKKLRDDEGYTPEDRIKQEQIWNSYAIAKLLGAKLDNQTQLFFESIGNTQKEAFLCSASQIIQFGIGNGEYATNIAKQHNRKIIGYDFAPVANTVASANGAEMRLVNLNATNANNNLGYQTQLENDFSDVSDVLLIRILEYLNPEAVQLLMISIMNSAKPGSRFYVEILSSQADITGPSGQITVSYSLKPGTVATFFNAKNNFKITNLDNVKNPNDRGEETLERLLIEKISF